MTRIDHTFQPPFLCNRAPLWESENGHLAPGKKPVPGGLRINIGAIKITGLQWRDLDTIGI